MDFHSKAAFNKPELPAILSHEEAHVRQKHSLDLLFIELLCILFWFNPIIWRWKRTTKMVHEQLADREVIRKGFPLQDYLILLKNYSRLHSGMGLTHSFSSPIIIHRLRMLTNSPSPDSRKIAYLLPLPALAFLMMSFCIRPDIQQSLPVSLPTNIELANSLMPKNDLGVIENQVPSISPFTSDYKVRITSHFGMRIHPHTKQKQHHRGIDFAAPLGTPIVATADGTVIETSQKPGGYGNKINLKHGSGFVTVYAHLQKFNVKKGQKVKKGDVIGYVGSSGMSKAPHLHYEVIKDGKPVNPVKYMPI